MNTHLYCDPYTYGFIGIVSAIGVGFGIRYLNEAMDESTQWTKYNQI